MKVIKVIDLVNDIANGKASDLKTYFMHNDKKFNFYGFANEYAIDIDSLNWKIEIIEDTPKEDKKINRVERKARNLTNQYIKDKLNEIIDKINGK